MSNDNAGRTSRTNGAAPMGSTVAIVVTALALVFGFLILRKVNDNDTGGATTPTTAASTTSVPGGDGTGDTSTTVAPTTTQAMVKDGTKVQVANCSTQNGVAKNMTLAIAAEGFSTVDAVSCSPAEAKRALSKVVYNATDPAAKAVAESLARLLGGITAETVGTPVPNELGTWADGSAVLLLLGNDLAGKTIAQITGAPVTGVTAAPTTAAPVTT
ncbi:MAG: LytR C-terminal domain-containing protein [Actinomycetota bacterium]|nr:LytR C-terminal domain-containing protein [Actinomycetota bacterium]